MVGTRESFFFVRIESRIESAVQFVFELAVRFVFESNLRIESAVTQPNMLSLPCAIVCIVHFCHVLFFYI